MFKYTLLLALLFAVSICEKCPATLLNKCETDLQKGFQICEAAAKAKGQDQQADINCYKYALAARKDCWPCICQIADNQGWKIKGCDTFMPIINDIEETLQQLREEH